MAESDKTEKEAPAKSSKMPLILGMVLALAAAGGGFYAANAGLLPFGGSQKVTDSHDAPAKTEDMPEIAFVPIDPIVVSLNGTSGPRHLRFRAHLEVGQTYEADVTKLMPRVTDVLNSYLRALKTSDLEDNAALARLRAQMLRRIQVVLGRDRVNDLLIMEFVLN